MLKGGQMHYVAFSKMSLNCQALPGAHWACPARGCSPYRHVPRQWALAFWLAAWLIDGPISCSHVRLWGICSPMDAGVWLRAAGAGLMQWAIPLSAGVR